MTDSMMIAESTVTFAGLTVATSFWPVSLMAMSKRTQKGKARARRNKANHGRKPNYGRN